MYVCSVATVDGDSAKSHPFFLSLTPASTEEAATGLLAEAEEALKSSGGQALGAVGVVLGVLIGCGCGRLLCAKKPAAKEKRGYRSMSMEE